MVRVRWLLFLPLLSLAWPVGVAAQGLRVKPMSLVVAPSPGEVVERAIEIQNGGQGAAAAFGLSTVALRQAADAHWEPLEQPGATAPARSCDKWVTLNTNALEVPPMGTASATMRIQVPRNVRGSYYCGILLTPKSTPSARRDANAGARVRTRVVLRFLTLITVHVRGPAARQRLTATDTAMRYVPRTGNSPATTRVSLTLRNDGETLPEVAGTILLLGDSPAGWRRIAECAVGPARCTPDGEVTLERDLERRLPSAKYRLQSQLIVAGRKRMSVTREVDFAGDPEATVVATDVALSLHPTDVRITGVPGSSRTAISGVSNPDSEPLQVKASINVPACLSGVAMGGRVGTDFSCAGWASVSPAEFTIPPRGRSNVRVTVALPQDADPLPFHYGDLRFESAYGDGQSAGAVSALITVENKKAPPPDVRAQVTRLGVEKQDGSKYEVTAQICNVGTAAFAARASVALILPGGGRLKGMPLEPAEAQVLPLGTPQFSGTMDFGNVPAGVYRLQATVDFGEGKQVRSSIGLRVEMDGESRNVTTLEQARTETPAGDEKAP